MIQFKKLRLHGFKSFVDRTEVEIGPGLTGIVGPNGCGKSNLVEALRWSMGESSTKRMRGGSRNMDDVIFSGTATRPARNVSEVSVLLDNQMGTAPAPYSSANEIEVSRKIERDHGSTYRINGKVVRARDVQLLYADILSGANSPYLVSQGKITDIIQAKPTDRRMILEEAAGITGLHARRHEAELRLRATDNNLKRLEDLVGGMESRLSSLKRQARQAHRYRNLSAQIRQFDVMLACLDHKAAHEQLLEIKRAFSEAENRVAEHLTVVTQLTKTQNAQAADLPDLRQQEARVAAALQARNMAMQRLEDEEKRLSAQVEELQAQLNTLINDRVHEKATLDENSKLLEQLNEEEKKLHVHRNKEDAELEKKEAEQQSLTASVQEQETAYNALVEEFATVKARKHSLENQINADTQRLESVQQRLQDSEQRLTDSRKDNSAAQEIESLRHEATKLEKDVEIHQSNAAKLEDSLKATIEKVEKARITAQESETEKSNLSTEINTLESVLEMYSEDEFRPVLEDVQPDSGFEAALSRALGDTLMASTDEDASVVWHEHELDVKDLPALPDGVHALQSHVKAPKQLKLALSLIGCVDSEEQGWRLFPALKPGQVLVSREGAYWRWDGLHMKPTASDHHSLQLQQKNKLADLKEKLPFIEKEIEKTTEAHNKTKNKADDIRSELKDTQELIREQARAARDKRTAIGNKIEEQASAQAEIAKLEEAVVNAKESIETLEVTISGNRKELAQFDEKALESQQNNIDHSRETLNKTRETFRDVTRAHDIARQEKSRREARLQAIGDERVSLQNRCIRARERLKELDLREVTLKEKLQELKKRPTEIRAEHQELLSLVAEQEKEKAIVSDRLTIIETELSETTKALKQAEAGLAEARESRAHATATVEERQKQIERVKLRIDEQFDMTPEELTAEAALTPENMPVLEELKQKRDKAARDRDMIGAVNLRAEEEATELEKELGGILNERNDLIEAIEELRGGIQKLNKEARERLQVAFEHINGYFREMFTRLFDGGKAHLSLIEADDPLDAGLEIFAQPPGKTLQSLSLLSGGEQTMTALALIFAMFMTNPGPICVMDEVDAPLDDANVDRFCDILEEFADKGDTRFLLITHHRLTMARMDRLYGVTMSEKGVSQLVSVDLNKQLDFLDEVA